VGIKRQGENEWSLEESHWWWAGKKTFAGGWTVPTLGGYFLGDCFLFDFQKKLKEKQTVFLLAEAKTTWKHNG